MTIRERTTSLHPGKHFSECVASVYVFDNKSAEMTVHLEAVGLEAAGLEAAGCFFFRCFARRFFVRLLFVWPSLVPVAADPDSLFASLFALLFLAAFFFLFCSARLARKCKTIVESCCSPSLASLGVVETCPPPGVGLGRARRSSCACVFCCKKRLKSAVVSIVPWRRSRACLTFHALPLMEASIVAPEYSWRDLASSKR
mmetsp:Transcript_41681/g.61674  ORF Transcript_41681/g.61674 Transcript_41681/m.61674 type:complete len:200 (-) Transcript_41681:691-1290(-)